MDEFCLDFIPLLWRDMDKGGIRYKFPATGGESLSELRSGSCKCVFSKTSVIYSSLLCLLVYPGPGKEAESQAIPLVALTEADQTARGPLGILKHI